MKKTKAFTLVELLITTSIFVIIMVTIYSAFHTGIFGYRDIEDNIKTYQGARLIMERINTDLRNSFSYSKDEAKFKGSKSEISFLTLVDTYTDDKIIPAYAFISYSLEKNKLMRLCRKNQQALNDKSEIETQELSENIGQINFSYGYFINADQPIEWKDSWGGPKSLPVAVKINFVCQGKTKQQFERKIFLPLAE